MLLAGEPMALVDTGIDGNGETIVSYIKSIGRSPFDLEWVIVTHFHYDHSGSAQELHELTGAKIVAHKDETEAGPDGTLRLRQGHEEGGRPWWAPGGRRRRDRHTPAPTEVHLPVEHGEVLPCLGGVEILHTRGHTPGSICPYLEKEKVLFVGDSILNNVDRLSRPLMFQKSRRTQLDESLRTLRGLEAELCSFGHGPPLKEDVMARVRSLTDRPYNIATWRIVLKNWRTLRAFQASTRRRGHWSSTGD